VCFCVFFVLKSNVGNFSPRVWGPVFPPLPHGMVCRFGVFVFPFFTLVSQVISMGRDLFSPRVVVQRFTSSPPRTTPHPKTPRNPRIPHSMYPPPPAHVGLPFIEPNSGAKSAGPEVSLHLEGSLGWLGADCHTLLRAPLLPTRVDGGLTPTRAPPVSHSPLGHLRWTGSFAPNIRQRGKKKQ